MTVLDVILKSAQFLERKGVESPRLQVELLLAHVLKLPRLKLYLEFERELTPGELEAARDLVRRRGLRKPLQHLVGSTSFCGFEILVNHHVLVPRPETELLAEAGWTFLNGLQSSAPTPPSAVDFGTGSGCLAIALAARCPAVRVVALDCSPEALDLARQNAASNRVADRIEFVEGAGFTPLRPGTRYDLIMSNPPYVPTADIPGLPPEVRDHDPRGALDGGVDGLDFYRLFATQTAAFLKPGGKLMLEFGDGQASAIQQIFREQKWIVEAIREDYNRVPRILIARRV